MHFHHSSRLCKDANINIQKTRRIHPKNREIFKITCKFSDPKLARNRDIAKFGYQNGEQKKNVYINRELPSEIGRVGISGLYLVFSEVTNCSEHAQLDVTSSSTGMHAIMRMVYSMHVASKAISGSPPKTYAE